jgi:arginine-tRNA-protein transferase
VEQTFSHYPAIPPPVRLRLVTLSDHECPYLPNRVARSRAFWADQIPPALYHDFMDAGFRRSGKVIYQPVCARCRECVPIRVPVESFRPSKSQRRCWRKNVETTRVTWGEPRADDESYALYRRYVIGWHGRDVVNVEKETANESREDFEAFLYESPVASLEFKYRDATSGQLLAVGICDASDPSLSSVYFYHDPAERRRGLGTFGALYEIEFARQHKIAHYYLGYHVSGCRTMDYKAAFRPHELLRADGVWERDDGDRRRARGCSSAQTMA